MGQGFKSLCLSIFLVVVSNFAVDKSYLNNRNTLIIGCRPTGFFSNFFGVINNLFWCESAGVAPCVYWDRQSLYYVPGGYNGASNVWEYYFEPVSLVQFRSTDKIYRGYRALNGGKLNLGADLKNYIISYADRKRVKLLIDAQIKIKQPLQEKIAAFYEAHMKGRYTIGLHLRGTDKVSLVPKASVLIRRANELAAQHKGCQFLVSSDDVNLIEQAQQTLEGPVIFYNSQRSENGKPVHKVPNNKAQIGEDVLIEVQLLAKTDIFIHSCSNVASAVLCFNPELKNIFMPKLRVDCAVEQLF